MPGRKSRLRAFAVALAVVVFVFGIGVIASGVASAWLGRPAPARSADCVAERAAFELVQSALEEQLAAENEGQVTELARARDTAFANYCDCVGASAAAPAESRAPIFTPGRRGTPPFAGTPGRPVFTPPGPPPGRPPVTLPPVTRGRPPLTPPGPPFLPPGPPLTPPGPPRTPPPPTPTP